MGVDSTGKLNQEYQIMIRKTINAALMVLALAGLQACYWDNEEELYPVVGDCDTTNVTYSGTVAVILDASCVSCHNSTFAQAGVVVDNYDDLKVVVDNGRFWGAINHEDGYSPMPQNLPKLNECDLKKIRTWIDEGAMDN
jgi:hypothetical protein